MAKSSLEKMKERLKKSSPKISGRVNLENMNQIKNFMFGKKKGMGTEDDVFGTSLVGVNKKIKKKSKADSNKTKKPLGMSPGALGGKIKKKSTTIGDVSQGSTIAKNKIGSSTKTKKIGKVKATAGNTKNFASTMATQKKLIKMGAKIKADGIMGPKTRAAMKKFMSSPKTMVDSFKKSNVSANKNKKAGIDAAKGDNKKAKTFKSSNPKLDSKGNYKGTNIKPTKLQLERMKKRRARASST